ncbi:MAG: alpha/beta hydrolase [Bacteroidota bacterium]
MKSFSLSIILLSLVLSNSLFSQKAGDIQWTSSFLEEEINTEGMKFGYLYVPENYSEEDSRLWKMAFILLKARRDVSEKVASIYFMGGWGAKGINHVDFYRNHSLAYKGDLIIFDYRGSGYSEPTFCQDLPTQVYEAVSANMTYEEFQEKQHSFLNACLDEMEAKNIDYNQFGTNTKARDAILLAEKLGYESYNLFGVSYGTKTILQYLRQSTKNIRSVILDSNCPLDYPINSAMASDYARSLHLIFEDCTSDVKCKTKYPQLKERYLEMLASLEERPLKVKLPQKEVLYLNRQELNALVHQLLYEEDYYPYVPKIIKKLSNRNKLYLNRLLRGIEELLKDNYNGLGLCNYIYDHKSMQEEAKQIRLDALAKSADFDLFDGYRKFFEQDGRFEVNDAQTKLPQIDVPALILAGKYDPITPPYYSESIRKYFSQHQYFELPFSGHGASGNYCGRQLTDAFLKNPESPKLPPCLEWVKEEKIEFK